MHDSQYREAIAWQNVAYNQPPHPSFFLGADMEVPSQPMLFFGGELQGDYNLDGLVDAADYSVWRDALGSGDNLAADGNHDGVVGPEDYDIWKANFGAVAAASASIAGVADEPLAVGSSADLVTLATQSEVGLAPAETELPSAAPGSLAALSSLETTSGATARPARRQAGPTAAGTSDLQLLLLTARDHELSRMLAADRFRATREHRSTSAGTEPRDAALADYDPGTGLLRLERFRG